MNNIQNIIDELIIIRSATHTQKDYNCFTIAIEKVKEHLPEINESDHLPNELLTPKDKDWYNAGMMAQRILQNDEIEQLKEKLKTGMEGQEKLVEHFNRSEEENQVLRNQNAALKERIKIMNAALHPNE